MPITNTQTVLAPIAPNSANDSYETHSDEYGKGGFRSITSGGTTTATAAEIGAQVSEARRKVGMLIYDTSTSKYYRCTGTSGDGTYSVENFGSTSGTVTNVEMTVPSGFSVTGSPITSSGTLAVSTSLTGIIKGTGSGLATATAGTDYAAASHTQAYTTVNNLATGKLVGRSTAGTGALEAITVSTGLSLSGGTLTATGSGGTVTTVGATTPLTSTTPDSGVTYNLTHDNSGVTAGSYGSSTVVPVVTVDAKGHVTSASTATITGFVPTSGGTITGDVTLSGGTTDLTVGGNVTVGGNLTVTGTTTTINSTTLSVDDKNIELGSVGTPSDTTADGGGITLLGSTDKTFNWVDSTDAWTSSEHLDLATGKAYEIAGTTVLSATALGTGVVGSSLTSVGTLSSGTWQGSTIAGAYGGTGVDLTSLTDGRLLKRNGSSVATAVLGTDYLSDASTIDGGTY